MSQAEVVNNTQLVYEVLFSNDEAFRPIFTLVLKATFDISSDGKLFFSKKQSPILLEGKHTGDPENSSYVYEPECAFTKLNTDVVVLGDAISNRGPVNHLLVDVQVGHLNKKLAVIGNRFWQKAAAGYSMSQIEPFETMPMTYENAFGGWDKRHENDQKHGFEPRNTVGKGFYLTNAKPEELMPLPNIEYADNLIQTISDRPSPAGLGFVLPHWEPRKQYAGTYDQAWEQERSPLLPLDFNRYYFNAASEGMVAQGYLAGNEPVSITNMTEHGHLSFYLPGVRSPGCIVKLNNGVSNLKTVLDTVIVNTKALNVELIWRCCLPLYRGPHDMSKIEIVYG